MLSGEMDCLPMLGITESRSHFNSKLSNDLIGSLVVTKKSYVFPASILNFFLLQKKNSTLNIFNFIFYNLLAKLHKISIINLYPYQSSLIFLLIIFDFQLDMEMITCKNRIISFILTYFKLNLGLRQNGMASPVAM